MSSNHMMLAWIFPMCMSCLFEILMLLAGLSGWMTTLLKENGHRGAFASRMTWLSIAHHNQQSYDMFAWSFPVCMLCIFELLTILAGLSGWMTTFLMQNVRIQAVQPSAVMGTDTDTEAVAPGKFIPASPILLPEGPWKQVWFFPHAIRCKELVDFQ